HFSSTTHHLFMPGAVESPPLYQPAPTLTFAWPDPPAVRPPPVPFPAFADRCDPAPVRTIALPREPPPMLSWKTWLRRLSGPSRRANPLRPLWRPRGALPAVERLEDRIPPATRVWSGGVDTFWSTAGNWAGG